MLRKFFLIVLVNCALLASTKLVSADWPDPAQAWLPPTDGFVWPKVTAVVHLKDHAASALDREMDGQLLVNLESGPATQRISATWLSLKRDGSESLVYVDEALSGTGGKNLRVATKAAASWAWIADMLCNTLEVVDHQRDGWSSLSCVTQRALVYERALYVKCGDRYQIARHEIHDRKRGVVRLGSTECSL